MIRTDVKDGRAGALRELRAAIVAAVGFALLLGLAYPFVTWVLARAAMPGRADGSLVRRGGVVVGSRFIGQGFGRPEYFHPRPSAAGPGYDASSSGGSNLGPLSKALVEAVRRRVEDYRRENGLGPDALVPADAVTASGSGLDPHISVANARLQAPRVARARGIGLAAVLRLVGRATEGRGLGFLGETGVNVLALNLALDELRKGVS